MSNERVREAAKLARRKHRHERGRFLAEGVKVVDELVADGLVEEVFATADLVPRYRGLPLTEVTEPVLAKLADTRTPQGVVAVARMPAWRLSDVATDGVLVVLHEVADPGNVGTIIRTADAAGCDGVVLTRGSVDPYNPKAVRATAGSIAHLPVVTEVGLDEVLDALHGHGAVVAALAADGSDGLDALETDGGPVALLFGSEAHGLPDAVRRSCDLTVAVPMFGRAESLNLAAAAAVTIYAAARARGRRG